MERSGATPVTMLGAALAVGLPLASCAVSPPTITLDDDVATLALANWTGGTNERTRVEVDGEDGPFLRTDWQDPELAHSVPLLGLWAGGKWSARVVSESGEGSVYVDFETGTVPVGMPGWTTSGTPGWEGYLLTGVIAEPAWALILDEWGRVVWYKKALGRHRVLRLRLRADGEGLRFAEIEPAPVTETSALVTVNWDGSEVSRHQVDQFNHDFVDTPEGDSICVVTDVRPGRSGADVVGDALVRVDEDGVATPIWSTWDTWEVPEDSELEGDTWAHVNALDTREGGGWWVGMRNLSALLEVFDDGSTGRMLGGPDSDWSFAVEADRPKFQHQFQFLDGGVVMMDDRDPSTGEDSRVLELTLDDAAMSATATWSWHHDPPLSIVTLGDVDRAADGSTLAVFSYAGVIDDIGPDGELRWELQTSLAAAIPYAVVVADLPGVTRVR